MISKPDGQFLPLLKTVSISLVLWVAIITLLPILIVYKKIIALILKVKHGERYGGFMDGADMFFLMPSESMDCLIINVFIIRSEKKRDMFSETRRVVQEKVFNQPGSYVKLTGSKQSFGGYPYLLKYDCDIEDIINVIDVPKDKRFDDEYIKEVSATLTKKELPKKNSVLWDVYVSNTPLEGGVNGKNKYYRYPLIVRFHHCTSDGTSLISFFIHLFGDQCSQKYCEELVQKLQRGRPQEIKSKGISDMITRQLKATLKGLKFWFELIFLALGRIVEIDHMKPNDVNALHGKQCGEKFAAWVTEGKPEYIELVKRIKRRVPNTSFTSVVSTALLASLSNYFVKNKLPVPEHIQVLLTMLLDFPKIDPDKPIPLKNKTTALVFELPLQQDSENLTDFLRKVSITIQEQTRYADVMLDHYFIRYVMGLVPLNFIPNTAFQSQTMLVANVPGGSQINLLDGCPIELFIPLAPNFHGIGVSFAILTYDERFQIALLVDKALLLSQKEAQKIVDDVLTNINLLNVESQNLFDEE